MKNVKIDEKSKFVSAVLVCVLLAGIAFFFGYKKLEDKAARINRDNTDLESRIASLEMYYLTEEQNKTDTEAMITAIGDIFSKYDAETRYEDGIYEAFSLYNGSGKTLELSSIGFSYPYSVRYIDPDTVQAAQIEEYQDAISFDQFDVVYEGKLTYEGLKSMVEEIATGKYNIAIANMTYHITADGYIEGSDTLSFYSLAGANRPYEEPPVAEFQTGLENLFGVKGAVLNQIDEDKEEN